MTNSLRPIAVGLLCILALALAAATLTSPVEVGDAGFGGGGGGFGGGGGGGQENGTETGAPAFNGTETTEGTRVCVEPLTETPVVLGLFLLLLGVGALAHVRSGLGAATVVVALGFWPLLFGTVFLTAGCDVLSPVDQAAAGVGEIQAPDTDGVTGGDDGGQSVTTPSILVAVFLVLAIVGAVAAIVATGGEDDEDVPEESPADSERRAEIGAVAGEAADRIEGEGDDVDNEVYRAWREMTDALDVEDPETSTTAEFADAAIEAGLRRRDVDELTGLFEEVRYGTAEATPDRERRAVEALRNIERQYGDADVAIESDPDRPSGGPPDGDGAGGAGAAGTSGPDGGGQGGETDG